MNATTTTELAEALDAAADLLRTAAAQARAGESGLADETRLNALDLLEALNA